jgi:8-oxo-dGTP pyrophosphatase MutT (NUDIX family)
MDNKVIYTHERFDLVQRDGKDGVEMKKVTVGVLPYVISDGLLSSVGVLHEYNLFRKGKYSDTIITGTLDPNDIDLLHCAMRELEEEGGYKVEDADQWVFLGGFTLSKASTEEIQVFAVNVSDAKQGEPKGDGSKQEELSKLEMVQINDAILTDEALFLASYIRLFDFFYQKSKS